MALKLAHELNDDFGIFKDANNEIFLCKDNADPYRLLCLSGLYMRVEGEMAKLPDHVLIEMARQIDDKDKGAYERGKRAGEEKAKRDLHEFLGIDKLVYSLELIADRVSEC